MTRGGDPGWLGLNGFTIGRRDQPSTRVLISGASIARPALPFWLHRSSIVNAAGGDHTVALARYEAQYREFAGLEFSGPLMERFDSPAKNITLADYVEPSVV